MGRQQYLTRLALGRSAFQDGVEEQSTTAAAASSSDHRGAQQYDSKGRPINPQTESFNAGMRQAQNEVLALVGVVERKDRSERLGTIRHQCLSDARQALLHEEHEHGEMLKLAVMPVQFFSHLWLESVIQRVQIGLYDLDQPVLQLLMTEWTSIWQRPVPHAVAALFPGTGEIVAYFLFKVPLILGVEQVAGRLQSYAGRTIPRRRSRQAMFHAISFLMEACLLAIDVALLPLEFHACAQRLGLVPALPLFPPLRHFWPWDPASFHRFGWTPGVGLALLRSFTSPAALLLLNKFIHRAEPDDDDESAIGGVFTHFRSPAINAPPRSVLAPTLTRDPIGWIAHFTWSLRARLLRGAGWDLVRADEDARGAAETPLVHNERDPGAGPDPDAEADAVLPARRPRHRSTALAHLPAEFAARALDVVIGRTVTLPWVALRSRAVAAAAVAASVAALTTRPRYAPFGGGPVAGLVRAGGARAAWMELGRYLRALGLMCALQSAWDGVLFAGVYGVTRTTGVTRFGWGQPGWPGGQIEADSG